MKCGVHSFCHYNHSFAKKRLIIVAKNEKTSHILFFYHNNHSFDKMSDYYCLKKSDRHGVMLQTQLIFENNFYCCTCSCNSPAFVCANERQTKQAAMRSSVLVAVVSNAMTRQAHSSESSFAWWFTKNTNSKLTAGNEAQAACTLPVDIHAFRANKNMSSYAQIYMNNE